jgi:oxidoreductase AflY
MLVPLLNLIDHIVHHLLSIYAQGAAPQDIKKEYQANESYQRPFDVDKKQAQDLFKDSEFSKHLADRTCYPDYLTLFQAEIAKKGYQSVIKEYLLKGDDQANDFLGRLYDGM